MMDRDTFLMLTMEDEGCPHHPEIAAIVSDVTIVAHRAAKPAVTAARAAARMHRTHKTRIHAAVLVFIALCLITEGWHMADLGFLAISVLTELQ